MTAQEKLAVLSARIASRTSVLLVRRDDARRSRDLGTADELDARAADIAKRLAKIDADLEKALA